MAAKLLRMCSDRKGCKAFKNVQFQKWLQSYKEVQRLNVLQSCKECAVTEMGCKTMIIEIKPIKE